MGKVVAKNWIWLWPIDGGKNWRDGNRLLGDGKTWNGLIGGSLTSGLLCVLIVAIMGDPPNTSDIQSEIFAHPLTGYEGSWFDIYPPYIAAFILGTFLGFACLVGDSIGSFFKRRRGMKREGNISSKAPLLDTLPFAIMVFLWGQLFLGDSLLSQSELILPMIIMVFFTPFYTGHSTLLDTTSGGKMPCYRHSITLCRQRFHRQYQ